VTLLTPPPVVDSRPWRRVALGDGTTLEVRPLQRADGPALAAAVASLSADSRYRRFLTPKPRLTEREVAMLADVDHHAREALVAVEPSTGEWVGVVRYAVFPHEPRVADVAVTVADAWQRRGVGTALLRVLVEHARREGIARLQATTLADNRPALRLLAARGFAVRQARRDTVELALELVPTAA
jgi:RimJ/RimL family protein N-acetyltransferase